MNNVERILFTEHKNLSVYVELVNKNYDDAHIVAVDANGNETKVKFENSFFYNSGNHRFSMKCSEMNDFFSIVNRNKQLLSMDKIISRADECNKIITFYHGKDEKLEQVWSVKCTLCGHEAKKYARFFDQCLGCNNLNKVTNDEVFKKFASKKHNNRYTYIDNYINSKTKMKMLCLCGHSFYQRPNDHLNGTGCPKCKISSGELAIERWMLDNKIEYIWQHKFDDLKNINHLKVDFYCPSLNTIIEYDGEGHTELEFYIKKGVKNPEKKLKDTQYNDMLKNKYAEEKNINMLRISYKDKKRINQILSSSYDGGNNAQ